MTDEIHVNQNQHSFNNGRLQWTMERFGSQSSVIRPEDGLIILSNRVCIVGFGLVTYNGKVETTCTNWLCL